MRLLISLIPSISFPFPLLPTPNLLLFSKALPFWTYHETQQHPGPLYLASLTQ